MTLLAGTVGLPFPMLAQSGSAIGPPNAVANRNEASSATVEVSRREVRLLFAPERDSTWGWSQRRDPTQTASYYWSATVEGMDGPMTIGLGIRQQDDAARTFSSLASVIAAGTAELCQPGMAVHCFATPIFASVDGQRVVLSLRDSGTIARMFGAWPQTVAIIAIRPGNRNTPTIEKAVVRYIDPLLPLLDSTRGEEYRQARRGYDARVSHMWRYIDSGAGLGADVIWLAVGDSIDLGIGEVRCQEDLCGNYHDFSDTPRTWGRWSLSDPSVVRLHRSVSTRGNWRLNYARDPVRTLVAVKVGRATIRVSGVHTSADSMTLSEPLDSSVTRDVLVTPNIARFQISPRPATMRIGERREFAVRVFDRREREIHGAPVQLAWGKNNSYTASLAITPVVVEFTAPGRHVIKATLGAHADTVVVDVVGPPVQQ